jgi:hypothetical protein
VTSEERTESRFSCHCSARYAIFAGSVFYHSQIVNFSDSGMRMKTNLPAKVGAILMVQITGPLPNCPTAVDYLCPPNRSIAIGQVKWCQRSGRHEAKGYHLGLKFQLP